MLLSSKVQEPIIVPISSKIKFFERKEISKDGVLTHTSVCGERDNSELISQFNSSDFSIQNLIAIGANQILSSRFLCSTSTLSMADSFDIKTE